MCRHHSHFVVPGTGERVPLAGVRVFATMNPTSVGGGRNRLPRSIASRFTRVVLSEPTEQEKALILLSEFASCIKNGYVTEAHVSAVHNFHKDVVAKLQAQQIGRTGGAQLFNLRDLIKVDVCHAARLCATPLVHSSARCRVAGFHSITGPNNWACPTP